MENVSHVSYSPQWINVQKKLSESKNIIDLGCGNNPVRGAKVAVDYYIEPKERSIGAGETIDLDKMKNKDITFINSRIDRQLPFENKEFDFAYSHHAFEHVDDPATACSEMMRIAKSGVIITPSIFADMCFGRSYHKWLMMGRENKILFFNKRSFEDRPFGEHPIWDNNKKAWYANDNTNPFDILLNDGEWYNGNEKMPRLSNKIKKYWNDHSLVMEVIFLWENNFEFEIFK